MSKGGGKEGKKGLLMTSLPSRGKRWSFRHCDWPIALLYYELVVIVGSRPLDVRRSWSVYRGPAMFRPCNLLFSVQTNVWSINIKITMRKRINSVNSTVSRLCWCFICISTRWLRGLAAHISAASFVLYVLCMKLFYQGYVVRGVVSNLYVDGLLLVEWIEMCRCCLLCVQSCICGNGCSSIVYSSSMNWMNAKNENYFMSNLMNI